MYKISWQSIKSFFLLCLSHNLMCGVCLVLEERGIAGGESISGRAASHFPLHPRQGEALRLIVRPGWWTFSSMEWEMECGIVESRSSIPWDPITNNPTTHTHTYIPLPPYKTHTQGSGSTPDLGQCGLCGGDRTVVLLFALASLRSFSERKHYDLHEW